MLNDGAPNVGANWDKDAYSQNELCLHALRLACSFLRRGGLFITKVFRSKDYNALLWVFQKFFNKVEANKPLASRFTSAEIFVVCQDFIAPEIVDDKLFDAKFIFSDTEGDMLQLQLKNEVPATCINFFYKFISLLKSNCFKSRDFLEKYLQQLNK